MLSERNSWLEFTSGVHRIIFSVNKEKVNTEEEVCVNMEMFR